MFYLILCCLYSVFATASDNAQHLITLPTKEVLTSCLGRFATKNVLDLSKQQITATKFCQMITGNIMDVRLLSCSTPGWFINLTRYEDTESFEEKACRLCKDCLKEDQKSLQAFNAQFSDMQ